MYVFSLMELIIVLVAKKMRFDQLLWLCMYVCVSINLLLQFNVNRKGKKDESLINKINYQI